MPDERWRPVPGYRGYEASSLGNVRGPRGRVLALQEDRDGYLTVKLGGKRVRVNVVVQVAFAGPPEVRHLDGNRKNNQPGNLEYGSRWRNEQDKKEGKDRKEEKEGIGGDFVTVPPLPVTSGTGEQDGL
jgi:hypothetical protein